MDVSRRVSRQNVMYVRVSGPEISWWMMTHSGVYMFFVRDPRLGSGEVMSNSVIRSVCKWPHPGRRRQLMCCKVVLFVKSTEGTQRLGHET